MAAYRVLVVEDNHEVRRMVTASIKTLGSDIDVLDVPSAEEALVISASLPLDLVVLDFRLPGMSGLEMVTRLRKRRPEAKIILVTGVEDETIRQQVAKAGAEAYFYKPIEIAAFLEAVRRCLWVDQVEPVVPSGFPPSSAFLLDNFQDEVVISVTPEARQVAPQGISPTLDERITFLMHQLKAVSVLLVNEAGQVLEVAGNPSLITIDSALLSSLMDAFKVSAQVSQAMGKGSCTSLQYFATQRQCLYVVPVGLSHALFALTTGYFEPDRLATIDRFLQLAARDLQAILANIAAEEQAQQEKQEQLKAELPTEVTVDPQTLERVEDMFAKAAKAQGQAKEGADNYWDKMHENDVADEAHGKDVLSYDQARELGLAPGEDKPI